MNLAVLDSQTSSVESVFHTLMLGVFDFDADNRVLWVNPGFAKFLNHEKSDLIGKPVSYVCEEADGNALHLHPSDCLCSEGQPCRFEKTFITKGGGRLEAIVALQILRFDFSGAPNKFRAFVLPATSEHERQAKLLNYGRMHSAAQIYASIDAIVTANSSNHVVGWNPAAERMFGYVAAEMIGQELTRIIPQRFQQKHIDGMARVANGGEQRVAGRTIEVAAIRKDGREFPVEFSLSKWDFEGAIYFTAAIRDITERLNSVKAIADSERRFRSIVEQSVAGIYIIQDGLWAYVNDYCAHALGYGCSDDAIGKSIFEKINDADSAVREAINKCLSDPQLKLSLEFSLTAPGDDARIVGASITSSSFRGLNAVQGLMQDITNKRRAELAEKSYLEKVHTVQMKTIEVASTLSALRDPYTGGHERRVAVLTSAIAEELGLAADRSDGLRVAALLHDIGKMALPMDILSKPARVSRVEYELIKEHSERGYEVLKNVEFPWPVADIVRQHHERFDGTGYPQGLKGEEILLEARIIAVADVIEAMSSHRPYRPGLGLEKALAEIERGIGSSYDPVIATAALKIFREKGFQLPP